MGLSPSRVQQENKKCMLEKDPSAAIVRVE